MSAYMVNREHITYLVQAAQERRILGHTDALQWFHGGSWYTLGEDGPHITNWTPDAVGQMLWDENLASINYRYPGTVDDPENIPGKIEDSYKGFHDYYYKALPFTTFEPPQVLMSCHCLNYQSCEHPGWETSQAKAFLDALERAAVSAIVGYGDAAWGAPPLVSAAKPAGKTTPFFLQDQGA